MMERGQPLANATAKLYKGDMIFAHTRTNENGDIPSQLQRYYFAAVFSASVYTVAEPCNSSFVSTPNAVTSLLP
jgi:hypothetical protein